MTTFVVRVYSSNREDGSPGDGRLAGVVDEISTGLHVTFHDAEELLSVLGRSRREGREEPES
jgi:hypothetical protein